MAIPHTFPSLLNPEATPSVLFIGAGMSFGIVPTVKEVSLEIRNHHDSIVIKLGVDPSPPPDDKFYAWADRAFEKLQTELGCSPADAKLRLADAMGITSNPRFHAKVGMPLRGNTPRHRVAARFAREGRWDTIWSLNWDCILETALESVGLLPNSKPNRSNPNLLPWRRWYCTWSPGDTHVPTAKQQHTLHVIKPHGCVSKLANGNPLFIVTQSELGKLTADLKPVSGRLNASLSDSPLTVVGWSAEEEYIHDNIQNIEQQGTLANEVDRLSIIDPFWQPVPPSGDYKNHNRLATTFCTNRNDCHFPTGVGGTPTTDELFQWLQTRYGLERMHQYAQANGWTNQTQELEKVINHFSEPQPTDWLNGLFDDFLSVWVRLCFNTSCVTYKCNSAPVPQNLIATHRRDEHIPWMYGDTTRNDLLAAIQVVLALRKNLSCPWSFSEYPGALWNGLEGHLVLPLPAWGKQGQPIELAALKPLMDGWNWSNKGAIKEFSVLPLLPNPSLAPFLDNDTILRSSVAWLIKANKFADSRKIGVVSLSDL